MTDERLDASRRRVRAALITALPDTAGLRDIVRVASPVDRWLAEVGREVGPDAIEDLAARLEKATSRGGA